MPTSDEVAAYRAAGHSVVETMRRFGIGERAVYKACQTVKARRMAGKPDIARSRPTSAAITLTSDTAAQGPRIPVWPEMIAPELHDAVAPAFQCRSTAVPELAREVRMVPFWMEDAGLPLQVWIALAVAAVLIPLVFAGVRHG